MLGQGFTRIVRARRTEPAGWSEKRAQTILVEFDKANDYSRHRCNWIMSISASAVNRAPSPRGGGRRKRTTKSSPVKCCCRVRNNSRNNRFTWLRLTARCSTFLATINPSRGYRRLLGLAKTWKNSPLVKHLNRRTEENSSALCNRWFFDKKRIIRIQKYSGWLRLNAQAFAAFGTTGPNNSSSATGFHTNQKTVSAFPPGNGRLISALHFSSKGW